MADVSYCGSLVFFFYYEIDFWTNYGCDCDGSGGWFRLWWLAIFVVGVAFVVVGGEKETKAKRERITFYFI